MIREKYKEKNEENDNSKRAVRISTSPKDKSKKGIKVKKDFYKKSQEYTRKMMIGGKRKRNSFV